MWCAYGGANLALAGAGDGCKHEENGEEAVGALLEGSGILEEA